ncbi:MAG: SulP family inorganic anion transporter, partial [Bauldia sp.]|nr:SulP family inorganic anion transporter [Bauldia sp.]
MAKSAADRKNTTADRMFASLVAGLICGVLAVVLSIGTGSLLFSLTLHSHLTASVGMALAATTVLAVVAGLTSSIRGAVAPVQEVPVIGLTAVVVAVVAAMPEGAPHEQTFATAIVAVMLSTIIAGIVAALLGYRRWGAIVRFVPYPVIGGFLAGTGWLIVLGGIGLLVGTTPELADFQRLQDISFAGNAGLTALLVVVLNVIDVRAKNAFLLPGAILTTLVVFNLVTAFTTVDVDTLRANGWLVGMPSDEKLWPPIALSDLQTVDLHAIMVAMIAMPTMVFMTVLSQLMNDSGIELASRTDVDLDRELRTNGGANLLSGALCGMPGFPSVALTLLAIRLKAPTRIVGVLVGGVSLGALLLGSRVLDLIPTFLLAGMLIWIGGALMIQWLIFTYRQLGRWEYLVIVMIFA